MRQDVVTVLINYGLHVYVCGVGWEQSNIQKNVHGSTTFGDIRSLMQGSKFVLNVLPLFTHGLHERILESTSNGAVCVTDTNDYIDTCFTDNQLIKYSKNEITFLASRLSTSLENPQSLQQTANSGYDAVKQSHTWKHRVTTILNILELHKKDNHPRK